MIVPPIGSRLTVAAKGIGDIVRDGVVMIAPSSSVRSISGIFSSGMWGYRLH